VSFGLGRGNGRDAGGWWVAEVGYDEFELGGVEREGGGLIT
jgi:hypothetical protein